MNNTDIVTEIDEELLNELTKLGTLDPNANEAKDLIKNIQALHQMRVKEKDLSIEDSKIQNERIRARDARILQLVGFGVTLGTFAIGWGLRSKWLAKGFKFEETGTFSSKTMMECFKEVFKKN